MFSQSFLLVATFTEWKLVLEYWLLFRGRIKKLCQSMFCIGGYDDFDL